MKNNKILCLLIMSFVVFGCSVANAETFKCIGKDGKATYQATKCPVDAAVKTIAKADEVNELERKKAEARLESLIAENEAAKLKEEEDRKEAAKIALEKYKEEQADKKIKDQISAQAAATTRANEELAKKIGAETKKAIASEKKPILCTAISKTQTICN